MPAGVVEYDARKLLGASLAPRDAAVRGALAALVAGLTSPTWHALLELRHEVTHRRERRGIYGHIGDVPVPAPMAFPRHMDVRFDGVMVPLDVLTRKGVRFAEETSERSATSSGVRTPTSRRHLRPAESASSGPGEFGRGGPTFSPRLSDGAGVRSRCDGAETYRAKERQATARPVAIWTCDSGAGGRGRSGARASDHRCQRGGRE
jgi:hypothetical protein